MPLRQLKHKVGDRIFETKQDAIAYAAENGGTPEKIVVETDQFIQADPAPEQVQEPERKTGALVGATERKGSGKSRKS